MAWDDVLSGIVGALGGGVDAWEMQKRAKAQQAEQERLRQKQEEDDAWRKMTQDRLARGAEQENVRRVVDDMMPGDRVDPTLAGRMRQSDMGHRIEETPAFESSVFSSGPGMPGLPGARTMQGLPDMQMQARLAPTAKERLAQQAAAKAARETAESNKRIEEWLRGQPTPVQNAVRGGMLTGKMPTIGPDDTMTAQQRTQQKVDEGYAMLPVELKKSTQDAQIRRQFAPPPAPLKDGMVKVDTVDEQGNPVSMYLPESQVRGKSFAKIQGGGGGKTGQIPAALQNELATMDTAAQMGDALVKLGDSTDWKGVGGFYAGSVSGAMAKNLGVGDPKGQQLRNYISNIKGTIVKLNAGTAMSPQEQALLETYVPTIDDSPMVIKQKVADLQDFIALKRENVLRYSGVSGAPDAAAQTSSAGGQKKDSLGIR